MNERKNIAIIGGGPAGLIAAEILSARQFNVVVYERKPTVGRKFLMAGRGGLNLTHSEDIELFIQRYEDRADILSPLIRSFTPQHLREWCESLGEKTFIGTSGRVFPETFKASPLLKAWIRRLSDQGVSFKLNHEWLGWDKDALLFKTPEGHMTLKADATLLALGGASWPRLGSDGSWAALLEEQGVEVSPLQPANSGFIVEWSKIFREKYAGHPLKPVTASFKTKVIQSEIMITDKGIEGGAIYALSSSLRKEIEKNGAAELHLDLKPGLSIADIQKRLTAPRGSKSFTPYLLKVLNLSPVALGLLMESPDREKLGTYPSLKLATLIKNYPLTLKAPFSIDRAISSSGGITFSSVNEDLMLKKKAGIFVAGEILDWEAPTGGYLLQACFATGIKAAQGIEKFLQDKS